MARLSQIHAPQDLHGLTTAECEALASEIRQTIIDTVSLRGGHLASNLGTVELTLALHRTFDSPNDKIIFDVGHQVYAHKLLTGRQELFDTLRSYEGMSGFPCRAESAHDFFDTGHSSTAISMALGMARARDLNGEDSHVIAVVGDGALTGGMCYEAMNDAGTGKTRLIVVLNDNAMSISPNVGALSNYFRHLRASASWYGGKKRIKSRLQRLPLVGDGLALFVERLKDLFKASVMSEGQLFESLGFRYLGPFDGHDIEEMSHIFEQAKSITDTPVLIHVITQKGHGYDLAERQPEKFHGMAPFRVENGMRRAESTTRSAAATVGDTLIALAAEDPKIVAVTAAMAGGTGLTQFAAYYPQRFFDVGIAEQHATSMCAGLARGGYRPYFAVYATFLQRAYDQLVHDVALQNLPVCILADHAGLVGDDGKTHHGVLLTPMTLSIPNLTILMPRDTEELTRAIRVASKLDGPSVIGFPKEGITPYASSLDGNPLTPGKWQMLVEGRDVALLACARMTRIAFDVARILQADGITATVVDCCSIKPMDEAMLLRIAQTGQPMVTLEEGQSIGGFGSEVARICIENGLPVPEAILGVDDHFVPHGSVSQLLDDSGLCAEKIVVRVKGIIKRREHVG